MTRPDPDAILKPLKPFQRRTVDHAFHRLFEAPDSTGRFLVADEVGLGKTLVARGIIARAIDHLWDSTDRIDIIYICSNANIARANLPKLQVSTAAERSFALATRLTLLATQLAPQEDGYSFKNNKLNFVSFTPVTSFEMGHSGGRSDERLVLYRLLEPIVSSRIALMNLLQGNISNTNQWRWKCDFDEVPIDPSIERDFRKKLRSDRELYRDMEHVIETWFKRQRMHLPYEGRVDRNRVIGNLRRLLAGVCVMGLEPDLVILDEFQRFKHLLDKRENADPAAQLAQILFNARTYGDQRVRTLLLSATPYKMFTADAEIEHEDHYEDFLATTRFLLNDDESRVRQLQTQLARFGTTLKRAARGESSGVISAKQDVENSLRAVMARTERVSASEDRDAMLEEPGVQVQLTTTDVQQYLAADALFQAVGDRDPVRFWKSAPYLLHFMQNYRLNDRLRETLDLEPEKISKVLRDHPDVFLQHKAINGWTQIDPGNGKLRHLAQDLLDAGMWKLLWLPPTIPYWPLEGPYEGHDGRTKSLLFSAWNVVPQVVSAVLSYEAERRMFADQLESYAKRGEQQSSLLRLDSGSRSRHRLLLLLLPCLPLADVAHPLSAPMGSNRAEWVRSKVESLLADPDLPNPQSGEVDDRWEWVVPLLLDPEMRKFLTHWRDAADLPKPSGEQFAKYVGDFLRLDVHTLGKRPADLAELLTEVALGSPALLAARTLGSAQLDDVDRRALAVIVANAFWRLFNRPDVIKLLSQLYSEQPQQSRSDTAYWRVVLRYCKHGNLQAVLDEAWHLLREQNAWSETSEPVEVATAAIEDLVRGVEPKPSRVHANFYDLGQNGTVKNEGIRIRTDFALRLADVRTEDGHVNQETIRTAFNSPFRPFVLTTTSIGQEGLDFHPWCHRLVHWDLPGNPVDLEQREGRVHRYKGHAVRQNVAATFAVQALEEVKAHENLWDRLFELAERAARAAGENDLVPHWIAEGECRVQRHVPLVPYSKEVEVFGRLKRQLAAYRVVFGQPRQQEMVTFLDQANLDLEQLKEWVIDLAPPPTPA